MLKGERNTNAFTGIQIFPKKGKGEIVLKDKKIQKTLSKQEIEESFSIKIHLKNIKEIYKRFGI